MNTRERFHAIMNFLPFDRLPVMEWASWWDKTIDRWHGEGLPSEWNYRENRYDICRHFGLDIYYHHWFRPLAPTCPAPEHHGAPLVQSSSDYEQLRPHLFPKPDPHILEKLAGWTEEQQRGDAVVWIQLDGFFWFPRVLFGIEPHLFAFYDEPELMHRMNTDLTEWMMSLTDAVSQVCRPDFIVLAEDMSYNNGPMLSGELFDEFLLPHYRKIIPYLRQNSSFVLVDSDGNVGPALAWFEKAGLDGLLPLERQSGVDVAELRERHPRMRFVGGFDKLQMNQGEAAMRTEFERLLPVAEKGGLIISCDHQTPPAVSIQDYRLYLRLFKEYAETVGNFGENQ